MKKVIAIDGPSGSGKSTIAKLLAKKTGYTFLDSGALYRATALKLLNLDIKEDTPDRIIETILNNTKISYNNGRVFLDDKDISEKIRTPEVDRYTSIFSSRSCVRDFLLHIQREFSSNNDIVTEGRDMTTIVFPKAWRKFFLTASDRTRAMRRYNQLKVAFSDIRYEDILNDIIERDERDSKRSISPLKVGEGVIVIDNSELTVEATIQKMLDEIGAIK